MENCDILLEEVFEVSEKIGQLNVIFGSSSFFSDHSAPLYSPFSSMSLNSIFANYVSSDPLAPT